ncbi:MAG: glycosyltransferase, partial [Jatrophihabitans sp.]|uniref:glycosyltransferase n=1 Tax=Jatrophihabitans sp. TaxID=1932789 RepID=UPI003F80BF94
MSRPIVQVATFVGPRSGGIRTVLGQLAAGYAAAGHEVVQIVPGPARAVTPHPWGARIELPGRLVPRTGYRLMSARAVAQELPALDPLRLEVHDRGTLRALGGWAREHGVPSCAVSHERLDRLMAQWTNGHGPVDRVADRSNRALAEQFDAIVCTTPWAAEEFDRLAIDNLHQVPLGVDAAVFRPAAASAALRDRWAPQGEVLLALATRLSPEKRPELAVECVAELVRRGVPARLVVAGDGPLRGRLRRLTSALPVRLVGDVPH